LPTILVDEQVGVNAELAVMLRLEVTVKAEQLLLSGACVYRSFSKTTAGQQQIAVFDRPLE
jgi:hypothetical protein